MRRSEVIIKSLLNSPENGNLDRLLLLMIVHYTFNTYYPYEGYGEWDVDVDDRSADQYLNSIFPAKLSKVSTYIKQLWDVR